MSTELAGNFVRTFFGQFTNRDLQPQTGELPAYIWDRYRGTPEWQTNLASCYRDALILFWQHWDSVDDTQWKDGLFEVSDGLSYDRQLSIDQRSFSSFRHQ